MDFDTKYSISFFTTLGLSLAGIISSGFLKGIPSFNLDFISKNNKYAIGKAGKKVYLLNNETKELSLLKDNFNEDIKISPTDRYVDIGKLYDTDNNMEKFDLPLGRTPSLYLDERFVIIDNRYSGGGTYIYYDLLNKKEISKITDIDANPNYITMCKDHLLLGPDYSDGDEFRLYNTNTAEFRTIRSREKFLGSKFTKDGKYLVNWNNSDHLYKINTDTLEVTTITKNFDTVFAVSPSADILVAVGVDSTLSVFNTVTWEETKSYKIDYTIEYIFPINESEILIGYYDEDLGTDAESIININTWEEKPIQRDEILSSLKETVKTRYNIDHPAPLIASALGIVGTLIYLWGFKK